MTAPGKAERERQYACPSPARSLGVGESERSAQNHDQPDDESQHRLSLLTRDRADVRVRVELREIGHGGLEARDEEWSEPPQEHLVVARAPLRELRDQLESIGARQRERKRAHHEMKPPAEFLLRQVRKRAAERRLEASDHHGVLLG